MTKYISDSDLDSVEGFSSRKAAKILGCGKSTINDARARRRAATAPSANLPEVKKPKILALDLETSPNIAHVWGLFKQNVGLNQLMDSTEVICFGAKWLGGDEVEFRSTHHDGKKAMLERAHALLNEADAVMGWNSKGFDMKHLNREFLEAGMTPPSPTIDLDLMLTVKQNFRFPSNKLDYVAQRLGVGAKVQHEGHTLWVKCMAGDDAAWNDMKEYQVQDVEILFGVYDKLLPWIKGHPNMGLFSGEEVACPNCGHTKLSRNGVTTTSAGVFPRYQCLSCGKWSRDSKRVDTTSLRSY
ncbi:DnaQ-like DNA polymerase III subunit [Microbacterium phage Pumpernickel]|uniref:DnaQ-like DNA polymerase III subunit n=1 Tax=Microbacterium phage Pumpernickel TaxID=2885983 RepID=A0AAE8Y7F5_9CAUD|nr:DnaQ-like DNA polymerase III subunit [Microbacterium phage Pumpernickel]UDL15895.1 DnaQ-like DNA polymerase III subunit [Microbacterium phage Pumpernickel]